MKRCSEYELIGVRRCCNSVKINGIFICERPNTVDYPGNPDTYCSCLLIQDEQLSIVFD